MSGSKAWISGCAGLALTADEKSFFADERPFGFILFRRNIGEASQVSDLVSELKEAGGRASTPVLVDQEGGRVQRLRPPLAPARPPAAAIGGLYAVDAQAGERAAWLQGRLLAADISAFGMNADCIPCLDTPVEGANSVIGDRAYSRDPAVVATLGRAAMDGLVAGGCLPVMKHMPGHGRGNADSHLDLPVVTASRAELEESDFAAFRALAGCPAGMSAHILFQDIDPTFPATLSPIMISQIIRGSLGFDGLLMSDDMSMKALKGDLGDLTRQAITAGIDVVLHCNGDLAEMRKVAHAAQPLRGDGERRAKLAESVIANDDSPRGDVAALSAEFDALLARVA